VSLFNTRSALPMVAIIAGTSLIALLILITGSKNIGKPGRNTNRAASRYHSLSKAD